MGEKRGACAHAPAGPVAAAARAAVRGVCAVGRPYRARPGVPHPCGAWALVPAVRRVPHGAGAAAVGSSGRAAGKRGSACFAASRYHLGRGARRALCPHGDGSVRRWERALLWGAVGVLLAGGVLRNLPAFAFWRRIERLCSCPKGFLFFMRAHCLSGR